MLRLIQPLRAAISVRRLIIGAAVVFAALQLTNPARTNPPVREGADALATHSPPAEISALLRRACYDCHSCETTWPWYSRVAPMSWLIVGHVNDGRRRLNFSDWPHDDPKRSARKWNRVGEALESGEMPIPSYTWIHAAARLTPEERKALEQWTEQEAARLNSAAGN
ncbi:MAG: heme-binding domain-containing protein [Verrucomicrobiota bacterium]